MKLFPLRCRCDLRTTAWTNPVLEVNDVSCMWNIFAKVQDSFSLAVNTQPGIVNHDNSYCSGDLTDILLTGCPDTCTYKYRTNANVQYYLSGEPCGCKNHTVNFRIISRGVFINGKPTRPGMLRMLWVLPELAPLKAGSIPKAINIRRKTATLSFENIFSFS